MVLLFDAWPCVSARSNTRSSAITVTMFAAMQQAIPREVTGRRVRQCVVMADEYPFLPCHANWLVARGAPLLAYGTASACEALTRQLLQDRPELDRVELRVFVRPRMPAIRAKVAYGVRTALVVARPEDLTPALPNYLSMDEADCMGEGNPPLPLLDFFAHSICRPAPTDPEDPSHWMALFTNSPVTATHWALVQTKAVDVLVGMACEVPNPEEWLHAAIAAADEPTPAGLEGGLRHRVQQLLRQGVPSWAGLEDDLLRESWQRRDREQAQAQARSAAKKAAADARSKARAERKRKQKEEEAKVEDEGVPLPPDAAQPPEDEEPPPRRPPPAQFLRPRPEVEEVGEGEESDGAVSALSAASAVEADPAALVPAGDVEGDTMPRAPRSQRTVEGTPHVSLTQPQPTVAAAKPAARSLSQGAEPATPVVAAPSPSRETAAERLRRAADAGEEIPKPSAPPKPQARRRGRT